MTTIRIRRLLPFVIVFTISVLAFAEPADHRVIGTTQILNSAPPEDLTWSENYLKFMVQRRLKLQGDQAKEFVDLWREVQATSARPGAADFSNKLQSLLSFIAARDPKGIGILSRNVRVASGFAKGLFPRAADLFEKGAVKWALAHLNERNLDSDFGRVFTNWLEHSNNLKSLNDIRTKPEVAEEKPLFDQHQNSNEVAHAPPEESIPKPEIEQEPKKGKKYLTLTKTPVTGEMVQPPNDMNAHVKIPIAFDKDRLFIVENAAANALVDRWDMAKKALTVFKNVGMDVRMAANPQQAVERIQEKFNETGRPVSVVFVGHSYPNSVGMGRGSEPRVQDDLDFRYGPATEAMLAPLKGKVSNLLILGCSAAAGLNSVNDKHVINQMADVLEAPVEGVDKTIFVAAPDDGSVGYWTTYPGANRVRVVPKWM